MAKSSGCLVLQLLFISACVSSSHGNNMGPECNSLTDIEIHYKNYFDLYMGDNAFTMTLGEDGLFVKMLRAAAQLCCSTANLHFILIRDDQTDVKEIEELVLDNVKTNRENSNDGVVRFYYPEFAPKKLLHVYDTQTPFLRLSRSPGPALVMRKPKKKQPVFVGEIVVKSWAITLFLISIAWVIGILAWFSDRKVNPKDFPDPFYVGMIEGFWWSIVTMTTVGYGDKTPKGPVTRILAVIWILISTIFISLFTANASSILAISQAEEDHTNLIGKKIGCLNSRHFFDVELNLGAQWIGFGDTFSFVVASQTGEINRLVFPNYLDFLFLRTKPEFKSFNDEYSLTNTLDHPFQIGMALAVDPANMTTMEESFLRCLRNELPTLEKQIRRTDFGMTNVKGDSKVEEIKVPLDSDSLLTLTYWFFAIIACFISFGLCWDYWVYKKKSQAHDQHRDQPGDVDMAIESNAYMNGGGTQSLSHNSSTNREHEAFHKA